MCPNALYLGQGHEGVCGQSLTKNLGVKVRSKVGMLALVRAPRLFLELSSRSCRGPQTPLAAGPLEASVAVSGRKGGGADAASIPTTAASADIPNA